MVARQAVEGFPPVDDDRLGAPVQVVVDDFLGEEALARAAVPRDGGVEVLPGEEVEAYLPALRREEGDAVFVDAVPGQGQQPQKVLRREERGLREGGRGPRDEVQKRLREPEVLDTDFSLVGFEGLRECGGPFGEFLLGVA